MRSKRKRMLLVLISVIFGIGSIFVYTIGNANIVNAEAAPKLSKSSLILMVQQSAAIKVKNTDKAVKWSSNDESIVTVKKGKVTGIKKGTAIVTALVGGKKLACKVRVVKQYSMKITNKYLSKYLEKHYAEWKYVFFDNETVQHEDEYIYTIRYQGGNMANILAGMLYVNRITGKSVFKPIDSSEKKVWKIFGI